MDGFRTRGSYLRIKDERGFGPPLEPMIFFVVVAIVAAFAVPILMNAKVPKEIRSGEPGVVLVPACAQVPDVSAGVHREGLGTLQREIHTTPGGLRLERRVNVRLILWVGGVTLGAFLLLWLLFRESASGSQPDARSEEGTTLISRLPDTVGAALVVPLWIASLLGILYLLPTLAIPARLPHDVVVTADGVQVQRRSLFFGMSPLDLAPDRIAGVDDKNGLRLFYRTDKGTVRAISVAIADDDVALAAACAAAKLLGLEEQP